MKIEFSQDYYIDEKSLNLCFFAYCDNKHLLCEITQEALCDINPEYCNDSMDNQFQLNQYFIEDLAVEKILNGENKILIKSMDVRK